MIGIGLNIGNRVMGGFDSSASAFFAATGITGATEQQAVNTLVTSLKSAGIWSKMKAVYPFVTDNRNLLSYTEDFGNAYWGKNNATITTNSTTAPDGTTTADSLIDNGVGGLHFFSTTQAKGQNGNNTFSVYAKANTLNWISLYVYDGTTAYFTYFNLSNGTVGTNATGNTASISSVGNGWYRCIISRNYTANDGNAGVGVTTASANGTNTYTGTGQSLFVWGAQLELGSTATTYQPIATTQQSYISNQFKYNLVNPVDSDAAFRGVFNGGWTFSYQGALPNGTNGYMDTKLNQSGNLTSSNNHISVYLRTDFNGTTGYSPMDCGITDNISYSFQIISPRSNNLALYENGTHSMSVSNTNSQGMYTGTSTSSTSAKLYKNGSVIGSSILAQLRTMFNNNVYLGAANISTSNAATYFSPRQQAFASIGQGLTDTEAAAFYNAVQTFNTSLARQVA